MDRVFLVLGLGVWLVAGTPRVQARLHAGLGVTDLVWGFVFVAFAVFFVRARRVPGRRAALDTVAQSLCALAVLPLGMPHFEGALLAVVGAQTLLVTTWPWAVAWVVCQGGVLFATILPSHELLGATKATGEYLAFSLFAMTAFALRERERRQRLELIRVQAELMGTRALLKDAAKVAEQRRIRRALHDSLGHHLAAAAAHLDAARGEASDHRPHLEAARSALDELTRESRHVIAGLEAGVDPAAAIAALQGSIPGVQLDLDLGPLDGLDVDAAGAVFRAVQEALTNAHRHGGASRVRVRATREPTGYRVRVEDDGRGALHPIREGVGLRSMRERVEAVEGRVLVDPGPPFTLSIELPVAS